MVWRRRMRVFKTKPFARFANREGIADEELYEAVYQAERGLIDADLGRRDQTALGARRTGQVRRISEHPAPPSGLEAVLCLRFCQE